MSSTGRYLTICDKPFHNLLSQTGRLAQRERERERERVSMLFSKLENNKESMFVKSYIEGPGMEKQSPL